MDEYYAMDEAVLSSEELEARGKRKKRIGGLILAAGLVLLLGAGGLTASNYRDDAIAGQTALEDLRRLEQALDLEADEAGRLTQSLEAESGSALDVPEQKRLALYEQYPAMTMPTVTIDGNAYVGIVEIPAIDRTLPVLDTWSYPGLKIAPNRFVGTAYAHDLVLCAHNYDRHFGLIKTLSEGDTVRFTDVSGNRFTYRVSEVTILQPTQVAEMKDAANWDLTLFTCTIGGATRVTVRCELTGTSEGSLRQIAEKDMSELVSRTVGQTG